MKAFLVAATTILTLTGATLAGSPTVNKSINVGNHHNVNVNVHNTKVNVQKPMLPFQQPTVSNLPAKFIKPIPQVTHFGVKTSYGYVFHGHNHTHWSKSHFSPVYGVTIHWCPVTMTYYYWCAWDNCFYPVSYVPYGRFVF